MPFRQEPKAKIWSLRNHKDLSKRPDDVFDALNMQLREGSVEPWDASGGELPAGILSLRWVEKSDPRFVRLTLNGRPINVNFGKKDTTIRLETHAQLRHRYTHNMLFLGFDLHNGFFNQKYKKEVRKWVSFRIHQ